MSGRELFDRLEQAYLEVRTQGEHIIITPGGSITEELRGLVKAHKPKLLDYLRWREAQEGLPEYREGQSFICYGLIRDGSSGRSAWEPVVKETDRAACWRALLGYPSPFQQTERRVDFVPVEQDYRQEPSEPGDGPAVHSTPPKG